ncbi:MAG: PQQ-binding-like beta-propeller repeat protein, partial [Thermoguttaceae bacterium]|nr:PQQ-binding-like beta-propeller repeat protein [Thermoguttaceae bacterium]
MSRLPGMIRLTAALLLVASAARPPHAADGVPSNPATPRAASHPDLANWRADPESLVTSRTVDQLQLAWKVKADAYVSHAPLLHGGSVFFTDWAGNVYKVDADTGKLAWKVKIEEPAKEWVWHGLAGTGAIGEGLLFEASVEGHAFALDLQRGEVQWKVRITDNPHAGNVGELLYHDGLVYIGLSSVEETLHGMIPDFVPGFRGEVIALEAASGKIAWRRSLVEPPHNGVGVWSGFALDPQMQALFFATSNNYTGQGSPMSDSIVAVHTRTGEILWFRQVLQHDLWTRAEPVGPDYGFGAGPQLFEALIDGQTRKLVGAGQKSGVYWVVDRLTGEMVWNHVVGYGGGGGGIGAEASVGDALYVWSNNNFDY